MKAVLLSALVVSLVVLIRVEALDQDIEQCIEQSMDTFSFINDAFDSCFPNDITADDLVRVKAGS